LPLVALEVDRAPVSLHAARHAAVAGAPSLDVVGAGAELRLVFEAAQLLVEHRHHPGLGVVVGVDVKPDDVAGKVSGRVLERGADPDLLPSLEIDSLTTSNPGTLPSLVVDSG